MEKWQFDIFFKILPTLIGKTNNANLGASIMSQKTKTKSTSWIFNTFSHSIYLYLPAKKRTSWGFRLEKQKLSLLKYVYVFLCNVLGTFMVEM